MRHESWQQSCAKTGRDSHLLGRLLDLQETIWNHMIKKLVGSRHFRTILHHQQSKKFPRWFQLEWDWALCNTGEALAPCKGISCLFRLTSGQLPRPYWWTPHARAALEEGRLRKVPQAEPQRIWDPPLSGSAGLITVKPRFESKQSRLTQ